VVAVPVADFNIALKLSEEVEATAAGLPVSVRVQTTVPAAFTDGALHVAVIPVGNPEATPIVDPAALLATVSPPTGVPVTVSAAVPSDCIDIDAADAVNLIAGACCTCSVRVLVAVNPSPLPVTVTVAEVTVAVPAAVSVSVLVPLPAESVTALLLHAAVTPLGSPLTVKLTAPLYVPLPARVTASVTAAPCTTASELDAAFTDNVGGVNVTVRGSVLLAVYVFLF
jgi:hypothetical protein